MIPEATIVISWLDKHQGFATVLLTAALVGVTAYYAFQNLRMAQEMKRARELAIEQAKTDEHREQLRELRSLADDAACALSDMWTVLGTFSSFIPRGNPPIARPNPIEHRDPDRQQFIEVYGRLRYASLRLLNRVEWNDTFHFPVGRAVSETQAAYNVIVHEDPLGARSAKSEQAILKANATVSRALRALQETSRARFAPLRMIDSRYAATVVLKIKRPEPRVDEILTVLRAERERGGNVIRPRDGDDRVVVHDVEGSRGEARRRLVTWLDAAATDWQAYFDLEPESEFEIKNWERREAATAAP